MNPTKKRLSIIKHAISITDIETIQLQVLKLALLKTDVKIQEILAAIQAENYAQAQGLINAYIEAPTENIIQRTSQEAQTAITEEEQAIIDEFDLFITSNTDRKPQEIDINDFLSDQLPVRKKSDPEKAEDRNYDALLNINVDNVLADNIEMDVAHTSKDTFFDTPQKKTKQDIHTSDVPKDTFFDTEQITEEEPETQETTNKETVPEKVDTVTHTEEETATLNYKSIPYIAQKLLNMKKQYPPIENTDEKFDSVENLLRKISQEGYNEKEIEETLNYIKTLTETDKRTEASQLLLICAATESKFGQFMLARELYKGILLTKNIPEAFTLMHHLALEEYPEALCDIAQFYEHGIGTNKEMQKAEQYFKEAMEFGIKRAQKHYDRLQKQNRGFFKK